MVEAHDVEGPANLERLREERVSGFRGLGV